MLKVECESCGTPFQVDEKRVPATGLRMRCPKCGHAFTVVQPTMELNLDLPLAAAITSLPVTVVGDPDSSPTALSDLPLPSAFALPSNDRPTARPTSGSPPNPLRSFPPPPPPMPPLASPLLPLDLPRAAKVSDLPMPLAPPMLRTGPQKTVPSLSSDLPEPARPKARGGARELDMHTPPAGLRRGGPRELELLGAVPPPSTDLPAPYSSMEAIGDFGELDLPSHASPQNVYAVSDGNEAFAPGAAPVMKTAAFGSFDFEASGEIPIAQGARLDKADQPASSRGAQEALLEEDLTGRVENPRAPAPKGREGDRQTKRRRGLRRSIAAAVALGIGVTGVSLQGTPYGAFGYRVFDEALHRSEYRNKLAEARAITMDALGRDADADARAAVQSLATLANAVPRATRLAAYQAFIEGLSDLRFGVDVASKQSAGIWRPGEFPDQTSSVEKLASSAGALARGQVDEADRLATEGLARGARDEFPEEVASLNFEIALLRNDFPRARAEVERMATWGLRGPFALARVESAAGAIDKAKEALDSVLAVDPNHAGALVRSSRIAHEVDHNDALALQLVERVLSPTRAAPASTTERSLALALRGRVADSRGVLGEAQKSYTEALLLSPSNALALMGQGEIVFTEGRYAEALTRFDAAVQIEPGNILAIVGKAKAMVGLERLADAQAVLASARERFPKEMRIVNGLANVERALGSVVEAERDYLEAIALIDVTAPEASAPYLGLSLLLASQDRGTEAREKLREARQNLPDSAAMNRAFGEVALVEGRYDDAIGDFKRALEQSLADVAARFRYGVALRRARHFDEAATEFAAVSQVDPDFPGLALERGLMFEQSGQVEMALRQFEGAIKKAPDDPDLQLRVASMYVIVGRFDDGLSILRKVAQARPNSAETAHFIGRALFGKSRGNAEPEALRQLKRSVDLDKNRAEYHLYYAWASNEALPPQLDLARSEVEIALRLDRLQPESYWQRAVIERRLSAIDDALDDVNRALTLKPSLLEAQATLAECLEDKKEYAKALEAWKRAIEAPQSLPDWHYRYARLVADSPKRKDAGPYAVFAATEGAKRQGKPAWVNQANFLAGELLFEAKKMVEAQVFLERFVENAAPRDPDRESAKKMLESLR